MSYQLTDEQLLGAGSEGVVLYRADLHALTGDVYAALLLSQILYWWTKMGRRPFYKYAAPCRASRPGDTWQEEMHFTRRQFESARDKIGARCYTGDSKTDLLKTQLVIYWVDRQGRTWYEVNEALLSRRLYPISDGASVQPIENAAPPQPIEDVTEPQLIEESETTTQILPKATTFTPSLIFKPVCELFLDSDVRYTLAEIWLAVLGQLQLQMNASAFRWIKNTKIVDIEGDIVTIRAANRYARDLLESRLLPALSRAVSDIAKYPLSVRVIVMEQAL